MNCQIEKQKYFQRCVFLISYLIGMLLILNYCTKRVDIYLRAENDVNNGGNPVVIRIYQLSTDVNFRTETSESFWKKNQPSFQRDIIGDPVEIIIHPREVLKLAKIKIEKNTVFIGAVADFYEPDKDKWSYLFDLSKYKSKKLLIAANKNSVFIRDIED